ncbi:MAG: copper chaperone PCu(A)C [Actinobacteria bacterium]|nr:copper chaperone PCu(A)C [Actinomycetota bacterium]
MSFTTRFTTSRSARLVAIGAASVLAVGLAAAPAQAHDEPALGSTCAMSGMTKTVHGETYVCVSRVANTKPRWGRGLPVSKSALTLTDGWAKAADTGMTAAFGMLKNPTDKPIRVIGAYSRAYSPVLQLHEVVMANDAMVMQQKQGGFVIPANGMLELKPGGNHVMFMAINKPVTAGSMVPLTLVTSDGALLKVTVLAKVFTGANETYTGETSGMSGM